MYTYEICQVQVAMLHCMMKKRHNLNGDKLVREVYLVKQGYGGTSSAGNSAEELVADARPVAKENVEGPVGLLRENYVRYLVLKMTRPVSIGEGKNGHAEEDYDDGSAGGKRRREPSPDPSSGEKSRYTDNTYLSVVYDLPNGLIAFIDSNDNCILVHKASLAEEDKGM